MNRSLAVALTLAAPLAAPLPLTPRALAWPCLRIDEPAFPSNDRGRCAKDFIAVASNPAEPAVRDFERRWASAARLAKTPVEQRASSLAQLREEWGGISVTRIDSPESGNLVAFITSAHGESMAFEFVMSTDEPGKLDAVRISPAAEFAASTPLTPELRADTVENAAKALRDKYVFPEIGAKMADSILAHLKAGHYDRISGETDLADRLTDDCRAISKDKHLRIRSVPRKATAAIRPGGADPRRENFGFKRVELFPGNIGYLRFDMFFEGQEASAVASSAMNFLAGADAIIIDLRHNGGGSPEMIRYITSYLVDSPTHLNDMVDRDGKVVEEFWTLENVPGRRPRSNVPLFILTSSGTFSGAEEFCYNLQNLDRATIIGETTGGGAHPVRGERLNDRFMIGIPYMRARNPITRTNWEGTGIHPDIKIPAATALDKALELARAAARKK